MIMNLLSLMKREWERTIFVIILFIGFVGLIAGSLQAFDFFRSKEQPPQPRVNVPPKFNSNAFSFLGRQPNIRFGGNHAMRLQVPQLWLQKMRNKQLLQEREEERLRREKERLEALKRKKEEENQNKTKPPKEKKPNPPIEHFLIFKGFMTSPSGEILAYLGKEDVQGGVSKRVGASFLAAGESLNGYVVEKIDNEWVKLQTPDGRNVTLIRGERHSFGVTDSPDYLLEADESEDPDAAPASKGTGGNPAKNGRNKTRNAAEVLEDLMKNNGGSISRQNLNKLLKEGTFNEQDVQRAIRELRQKR